MTDIIYIEELVDAYDEARRTAWILGDRMEDYGERARKDYEQAHSLRQKPLNSRECYPILEVRL